MKTRCRRFSYQNLLVFCIVFSAGAAFCQTSADTTFLVKATQNAESIYTRTIGVESHLYNGVLYKEYNPHANDDGFPYFLKDDWTEGNLLYDGEVYQNVPMLYDVINDKLIIDHDFGGVKLSMISEKVGYFILGGHTFVRLETDSARTNIRSGFYELLYDGTLKAYAKWQKIKNETIAEREIKTTFLNNNRFYIFKNDKYYQVKSKSSVLQVLADRKAEVRKYIRKNGIHFHKDRGKAIAEVVSFYDQQGK